MQAKSTWLEVRGPAAAQIFGNDAVHDREDRHCPTLLRREGMVKPRCLIERRNDGQQDAAEHLKPRPEDRFAILEPRLDLFPHGSALSEEINDGHCRDDSSRNDYEVRDGRALRGRSCASSDNGT